MYNLYHYLFLIKISDKKLQVGNNKANALLGLTQMILFPCAQHIAPRGLLSWQQNLFQGDLESVKRSEADTHSDGALDPVHGQPFVKAMMQPLLPAPQT